MKLYLLKSEFVGGTKADSIAAIGLIRESGGRWLHVAPIVGGWVVECTPTVAGALGLIPWE
jgi:hypothetical protein